MTITDLNNKLHVSVQLYWLSSTTAPITKHFTTTNNAVLTSFQNIQHAVNHKLQK